MTGNKLNGFIREKTVCAVVTFEAERTVMSPLGPQVRSQGS